MSDPSNVICSCAGFEFDVRRRDDTCIWPPPPAIPLLYQYQPKKKSKKNPESNLTARIFPALVFSLVPNSFVYSDTQLQLARRWKSILQHLACVLHFADELCLLSAFCCPRGGKVANGGELSEGPPAYMGKSIRFACAQLAAPLFICFCFIFKKQKLNKTKKNIGHKPLSGFLGFLGSEKKGEQSLSPICCRCPPMLILALASRPYQQILLTPPLLLSFSLSLLLLPRHFGSGFRWRAEEDEEKGNRKRWTRKKEKEKQPRAWRNILCACALNGKVCGQLLKDFTQESTLSTESIEDGGRRGTRGL